VLTRELEDAQRFYERDSGLSDDRADGDLSRVSALGVKYFGTNRLYLKGGAGKKDGKTSSECFRSKRNRGEGADGQNQERLGPRAEI